MSDDDTATIEDFPGYTFYRDGRITNKYGKFIGITEKDDSRKNQTSFVDKNGKRWTKSLHCMIIWAFTGEAPNGRTIIHLNGNKHDYHYDNLQYKEKPVKEEPVQEEIKTCKTVIVDDTATIEEFPGYTFYRDGRASNKYGQFIGTVKENGYIKAIFSDKNGKKHNKGLHIMIMIAFSGELQNGRDVDHINCNKQDNRYENLQYLDRKSHNMKTRKENPEIRICRSRPIQCIDEDGNITKFLSVTEASRFLNPNMKIRASYERIMKLIKNKTSYNGYTLSFIEDNIEGEIWKTPNIDSLESHIEVSNLGRIKHKTGKITSDYKPNNNGYIAIYVKINGKKSGKGLHTLVCSAFHGKQPEWATSVNHIDGDPLNNKADNLEWSNAKHQANSWRSKIHLMKDGIIEYTFDSIKEASEFLGVSYSIHSCLAGKAKTVKGYSVIRDSEKPKSNIRQIDKKIVNPHGKEIYKLDVNKNIIKEFPTMCAAVRELFPDLEISKYSSKFSGIYQALVSGCKFNNYYWRYKTLPDNIEELKNKIIQRKKKYDEKKRNIKDEE